ncbi:hypothetical protein BC834DRAFT_841932 [Gloeopeniophorella convolvens]|nr:hypothetical protein BC834DRAFT_841932 [Gloeopeniophorella convolvens]
MSSTPEQGGNGGSSSSFNTAGPGIPVCVNGIPTSPDGEATCLNGDTNFFNAVPRAALDTLDVIRYHLGDMHPHTTAHCVFTFVVTAAILTLGFVYLHRRRRQARAMNDKVDDDVHACELYDLQEGRRAEAV